jgi:hypothetical protein
MRASLRAGPATAALRLTPRPYDGALVALVLQIAGVLPVRPLDLDFHLRTSVKRVALGVAWVLHMSEPQRTRA